jgi:hypothetical protein
LTAPERIDHISDEMRALLPIRTGDQFQGSHLAEALLWPLTIIFFTVRLRCGRAMVRESEIEKGRERNKSPSTDFSFLFSKSDPVQHSPRNRGRGMAVGVSDEVFDTHNQERSLSSDHNAQPCSKNDLQKS